MDTIDQKTLIRIIKGDRRPLQEIFEAYFDEIRRFVFFKVGEDHLADDLTSNAFLKSFEYILRENTIDNVRAFLYQVARNEVAFHYRKLRPTVALEEVEESSLSEEDLQRSIDFSLQFGQIQSILGQLREDWRELLFLRFLEELSYEDISKITGKTVNTIRVTIHRAIREIQKILFL